MVQTNTVVAPGQGAAVLRIKGSEKGLALGLGSAGLIRAEDPWLGGALAVAEACRNVACVGARPIALTDCLNFGDPEHDIVWAALNGAVDGIRDACLALDVPIISGNVSLYNETEGEPIVSTPIVGALGLIENVENHARAAFAENQTVWLMGGATAELDLAFERRLQECVIGLIGAGIVQTAADVGEGGLGVALSELALAGGVGFTADRPWTVHASSETLFAESPSRIIVASRDGQDAKIESACARAGIPALRLGITDGRHIQIGDLISLPLDEAYARWSRGLERVGEK